LFRLLFGRPLVLLAAGIRAIPRLFDTIKTNWSQMMIP
jgi:hypothetical protein